MNKMYVIFLMISVFSLSYLYGLNVADSKCKIRIANQQTEFLQKSQKEYFQNKRLINEKVYKTGVSDIRNILFDKYTFAE